MDYQVDTYFCGPRGRLKIREGNIENCLVWYLRENVAAPKPCDYQIIKFQKNDFRLAELKSLLTMSLGILIRVEKTREIFIDKNVKIHLDTVPNLGKFVEIEVFATDSQNEQNLCRQCEYFLNRFDIGEDQLVAKSYADLI